MEFEIQALNRIFFFSLFLSRRDAIRLQLTVLNNLGKRYELRQEKGAAKAFKISLLGRGEGRREGSALVGGTD